MLNKRGNKDMKLFINAVTLLTFVLMLSSCTDDYDEDDMFTGLPVSYVYDSNGDPVADAKIVVQLDFNAYDSTGVLIRPVYDWADSLHSSIRSMFNISDSIYISFLVRDHYSKDTVNVLFEGIVPPGVFVNEWDRKNSEGKYVKNGVYETVYTEFGKSDSIVEVFTLVHGYDTVSENEIEYITYTDKRGRFYFDMCYAVPPYELHPPFYTETYGPETLKFSEYIKIWAIKDGLGNAYIDSVNVDEDDKVVIQF